MAELQELKGKNWMAAMSLCWFFGPIGGHRFYTGKIGTAWAMFGLSVIGLIPVTWVWSFIDGIMLASGNFTHEDGSELYERVGWFGWTYVGIQVLSILAAIAYMGVFVALVASFISGALGPDAAGSAGASATGL